MTAVTTEDLTKKRPEKSLTEFHLRTGGRNNEGRTTVRFRGGGHKRLYRIIDFKRDKKDIPGKISTIEYDFWGWALERWERASTILESADFPRWIDRAARGLTAHGRGPNLEWCE